MSSELYGDALIQQLREGWAPLPSQTLFAMAIGGLKVRLMRSSVTMLSIVLAIAFLAYTGLTNKLTYRLATLITELEDFEPLKPDVVSQNVVTLKKIDLVGSLDETRRMSLAKLFELDEIDSVALVLPDLETQLTRLRLADEKMQEERRKVEADPDAVAADRLDVASRAQRSAEELAALEVKVEQSQEQVELGQWIRGKADGSSELTKQLADTLKHRLDELGDKFQRPSRFDEKELKRAGTVLAMYGSSLDASTMQSFETVLAHENRKRQATELKSLLRRAGINLQATLEGNPMDSWLVTMALLTCAVGIANAMLMSVTERFREIGTMKCLGAQDNLVVKLFLLESSVLGVIGAVIGIVLGLFVALLGAGLQYYGYGMRHFPLLGSLTVIGWSVLSGMILAIVGAVYPAYSASRMRPIDALRVDE